MLFKLLFVRNDDVPTTAPSPAKLTFFSLRWRHDGLHSVSSHQPHGCLLNRSFGRRSKKTSKLRVTGLCVGNSPVTGEFPAQMASNAENVSIWWRHHILLENKVSRLSCCHHVLLSDYTQDIIQTQIFIDLDLSLSATVRLCFSSRNMYVWWGVLNMIICIAFQGSLMPRRYYMWEKYDWGMAAVFVFIEMMPINLEGVELQSPKDIVNDKNVSIQNCQL